MPIGFENIATSLDSPALEWAPVVPSDSVDLATPCRALYVGSGGTVRVRSVSGRDGSFINIPPGGYLIGRAARVLQTGTTATDILALW